MSNIPEEVENDPAYRRKMLYAWSEMLKERDDTLKALNKELENVDVLRFDRSKIEGFLYQLEEKDRILMSSRYIRVISNATLVDRAIVGLRSFFRLRSAVFRESLAPILGMVIATSAALAMSNGIYEHVKQQRFICNACICRK